tara:strand:+ start:708 stop:1304 length:597 start_codon:yes stop_codon:yes gene_type:complete
VHNYSIQDFIVKVENIAKEGYFKSIDNVIYKSLGENFSSQGTIGEKGEVRNEKEVRSVNGHFFNEEDIKNVSQRIVYNESMKLVTRLYDIYNDTFKHHPLSPKIESTPVLHFLKYTADDRGHYDWHTDDSAKHAPRTLTMLIGLNDNYSGGELKVLNDSNPVKLRRNQAVIFPSNFLYSHKVEPVTEGERKVLVVWIQ